MNGGGAVTLQFQRSPFKPLRKTVFVPWNQIVVLPPVQMELSDDSVKVPTPRYLTVQVKCLWNHQITLHVYPYQAINTKKYAFTSIMTANSYNRFFSLGKSIFVCLFGRLAVLLNRSAFLSRLSLQYLFCQLKQWTKYTYLEYFWFGNLPK